MALFLEKGYTRTTTGEIAKAAGIGQSSFFHVFPSKEALLLELVKRMFSGQFALAGQHSGEQDPVLLYAVETALQLHIAELTEPLRELCRAQDVPCDGSMTLQQLGRACGIAVPAAAIAVLNG